MLTAAHCVVHKSRVKSILKKRHAHTAPNGDSFAFFQELYVAFNKKRQPKTKEDWGFFLKLKADKEHIVIPEGYTGHSNDGFDIAIIKVPEEQ